MKNLILFIIAVFISTLTTAAPPYICQNWPALRIDKAPFVCPKVCYGQRAVWNREYASGAFCQCNSLDNFWTAKPKNLPLSPPQLPDLPVPAINSFMDALETCPGICDRYTSRIYTAAHWTGTWTLAGNRFVCGCQGLAPKKNLPGVGMGIPGKPVGMGGQTVTTQGIGGTPAGMPGGIGNGGMPSTQAIGGMPSGGGSPVQAMPVGRVAKPIAGMPFCDTTSLAPGIQPTVPAMPSTPVISPTQPITPDRPVQPTTPGGMPAGGMGN